MKKLILITLLAATVQSAFTQVNTLSSNPSPGVEADTYLKKAKKQRTAAWICLGGGTGMFLTGVIIGATK
ncbi:MAG TPA: hypothetical protein VKH37_03775, partial [Ferruginibacter sp.]|nr:hypothetical protein [Ferruginibacter sp.]